ncbi:hypothetical protein CIG75_02105 [Tumebacillus algifaecis]|uniref:SLAP domain-containing protein n=1 Tax=Tumebacillus algifaecis TaxID=1214604 RepID=A0A223CXQ4_9BACL|nr:SLAP domain-containing protein [Tumebacillus algifaecis]ASS73883.1 hypothetical protein CIG75_02105 [Tumebacillus algifaecis]
MEENKQSFLSRLFNKQQGQQVQEATPVDESKIPTVGRTLAQTIIAFTSDQEEHFSEQEKEALRAQLLTMPKLQIGELNFLPLEAGLYQGGYYVKVFIRNGLDVQEEITLQEVPMYLLDAKNEPVAGGVFELQDFGTLRFGETRYWTFIYAQEQVYKTNADLTDFTIQIQG